MSSINSISPVPMEQQIMSYTGLSRIVLDTIVEYLFPDLTVVFKKNLLFKQNSNCPNMFAEIAKLANPQVILWYIGPQGFKEEGANFCRDRVRNMLKLPNKPECYLYDLTAWGAFAEIERTINEVNANVNVINDFAIERLRCFPSQDILQSMQKEENGKIVKYVQDIVSQRSFIFKASENQDPVNKTVLEVFNGCCPMLNGYCPILQGREKVKTEILKLDAAKAYSAVQYIEGLYLVERMIKECLRKGLPEINIVFALPENEWKYYQDSSQSFFADLAVFLKERFGKVLLGKTVNVMFYTFSCPPKRYYLAGNKTIWTITKAQLVG